MIFFVFLVISFSPWQPSHATIFTQILPQSGRVLLNHVIQSFSNVFSFMECVKKCEANVDCHSVNMHTDRGVCEGNSHTHLTNPEHLVPASNASHYILYFFRPLLLCNSQLCSDPNNEVCFINSDGMSYRCQGKYHNECCTAIPPWSIQFLFFPSYSSVFNFFESRKILVLMRLTGFML